MNRFIPLALCSQLFIINSFAQSANCNTVRTYFDYNATGTFPIPALKHEIGSNGQPRVIPDNEQQWNVTMRLRDTSPGDTISSSWAPYFIDTGKTDTANMGLCVETAGLTWNDDFLFSEKVLRRAAEDKGDCKTMFGVQCVDALKRHFSTQAIEYARKGECPTAEYGFISTAQQNQTVPWECAVFFDGKENWNSDLLPETGNLTANLATTYEDPLCDVPLPGELPSTMHMAGGVGDLYNNTVRRFPTPSFFTFFPNYTFPNSGATPNFTLTPEDVHVEIVCRTATDIQPGSFTPPSAEEILATAEYNKNVTDPKGTREPDLSLGQSNGTGNGTGSGVTPSSSTAGVAPLQTVGPVLGAGIGLAALLLI